MSRARSPFHPDLRRSAALLPRRGIGPRMIPLIRRLQHHRSRRTPDDVTVVAVGPTPVRVHHPHDAAGAPCPGLLWIHGGGYVMGSPAEDDGFCRHIARRLGMVVAAVDYRLAPEHPFPTPLHDCYEALAWLAAHDDVDPARLAIGGASAGGGLAAALALLARDRDEIEPVFQLLSYPMLDDRTVARTDLDGRNHRLWTNSSNRFAWRSYLGSAPGSEGVSGLAAPGRHEDLRRLPPAWIGVGTCDLFHDEDVAYAERLREAGVPCETFVVPGAFHGFDVVRARAAVSQQYRAAQVRALGDAVS
jgi:acetyl esterase/lipase